jgi:hypothetical protein
MDELDYSGVKDSQGQPIEFFLTPGSYSDASAFRSFGFDLPEGACITGDKADNDKDVEDIL